MRIAIGSDHAGFQAKERLRDTLHQAGHEILDKGTSGTESCDYPDFAVLVAGAVADKTADRGILICGTGIGMAMTANKIDGIRAAVCTDEFTAEMSRKHNDANVLCLGTRVVACEKIPLLAEIFLRTSFEGGRHERRVRKIDEVGGPQAFLRKDSDSR